MLTDAIAAEWYTLSRDRKGWFWGFAFVPLITLISGIYIDTYTHLRLGSSIRIDLGGNLLAALGSPTSFPVVIFFAFGAAAIFANDYRWETWRLISSRNTRANLLWAKIVVYGMAIALSILAIGFASIFSITYAALLNGSAPPLPAAGLMLQVSGVAIASWLELLVLGTFTALASVVSRSMIGAMISAVAFAIIQLFAMTLLFPAGISTEKLAAVPHFSAQVFSAFAVGYPIMPSGLVGSNTAALAVLFLICWIAVLGIFALIIFQRQDLARE